jgi:hypothetical protein
VTARIQPAALARIKGATRLLFRELGSLEAVAEICGVSHSQAGRYQSLEAPDVIAADKIAVLEAQDGVRPRLTEALAALNGNVLLRLPQVPGAGAWAGKLGELAREAGTLMTGLGRALEDGAITAEEITRLGIRTDVGALQSTLAGMDRALEEIQRGRAAGTAAALRDAFTAAGEGARRRRKTRRQWGLT